MAAALSAALPVKLRCEYLENPLGLDEPRPRLSWQMKDDRRGARQSGYQVQAAKNADDLAEGKNLLWDSGRVHGDQSIHIEYAGPAVPSRTRVSWRVKLWDAEGKETAWSEIAFWETGLLDRSEWTGQWIGSPHFGGPYTTPPVPYVRKTFTLGKAISRARLYATGLGIFEIELNGQRVDDGQFLPGRTEYKHRVQYHVFDVTGQLTAGNNAIGALLGDGWYCGHLHSDPRQFYGDRPKLLAQLVIDFVDGTTQTSATDASWSTATSPIRSSDMLMGEDYDARLELPGWSTAAFDASKWELVQTFQEPNIAIVSPRSQSVRKTREIVPPSLPKISANKRRWIFDLGQNMVGHVRLKLRNQPAGNTIDLRHVEMLDKDGKPYMPALRSARATDHYTTKGGDETFEPRFTFHGFRYVEVRDVKGVPEADTVTGVVVHSDLPTTGTFECSDPMLNQLQSNITWSQRGNFLDFPTDCPQRDERMGWTGDAQVFIRTAAFNMEVAGFFRKWLADMADAQFKDVGEDAAIDGTKGKRVPGGIPSVIPYCASLATEGGPAWSDAAVICPWTVYLCYGDTRLLAERYDMMTKFVEFLRVTSNNLIRADETNKWRGYGDWLSQNADTPKDLIGTAFTVNSAELLSKIAGVLGHAADVTKYQTFANEVRAAWQKKYIQPDGNLIGKTQTAYVLALHFRLVPDAQRGAILSRLVQDIESRGTHLSTGFVGTPYLTHVLTENGRPDVAYALLNQKTFPGWLFPITHGATTMLDRWDGWTPEKGFASDGMNSYNHYAYGAVGEWMYARIGGIDLDPAKPAHKHVIVRPIPGGGLTHAKATLESPYGQIASGWRIDGGTLTLDVTIPANATATITVPTSDPASVKEANGATGNGNVFEVGAGQYRFTAKS
ncbi:MAG: alpha-L-rhamnosidase [Phycisphaerales bacterium]|nr:alpha-L-rhamnosidase [Phycisphaerales bacterium]